MIGTQWSATIHFRHTVNEIYFTSLLCGEVSPSYLYLKKKHVSSCPTK